MGRRAKIPKSAQLVNSIEGIVNCGRNKGKRVKLELWRGMASHGYATGYRPVEHYWLKVLWPDKGKARVYQYSGKNLALAERDWQESEAMLDPIGS